MKHKINGKVTKLKKSGKAYTLTDKQKMWLNLNKNAYRTEIAKCLGISRNTVINIMKRENMEHKARRKKSQAEKNNAKERKALATANASLMFSYAIALHFPDWVLCGYDDEALHKMSDAFVNDFFGKQGKRKIINDIIEDYGNDIKRQLDIDTIADYGYNIYINGFKKVTAFYRAKVEKWCNDNIEPNNEQPVSTLQTFDNDITEILDNIQIMPPEHGNL